jgi:hypothetical protein
VDARRGTDEGKGPSIFDHTTVHQTGLNNEVGPTKEALQLGTDTHNPAKEAVTGK